MTGVIELFADLGCWRMAGHGCFVARDEGGPGLFWYTAAEFADFSLRVDWRSQAAADNSGVFIRVPPLGADDAERDWHPAVEHGFEIQIDDRGYDPSTKLVGSAPHMSGAVYRLAPALCRASRPLGEWNTFRIEARGAIVAVVLNGIETARLAHDVGRRRSGYVALQCHHLGSRVQFRHLRVEPTT